MGFVSTKEAAKEMGVSVQHCRLLIRSGKLKAEKLGRDWHVSRSSLEVHMSEVDHDRKVESELARFDSSWGYLESISHAHGESYSLHLGDAVSCLKNLPEKSIDTCLTSPPYWKVRDYGHESQIGLEDDIEDYIENLVQVFRCVKRCLKDDGTVWLNVGDTYLNGTKVDQAIWFKNKQLSLVPFRLAIALQSDGWIVRNSVVWNKPNAMPASVMDRLSNMWEPVFLLSKSDRYYFDLDSVRIPHKTDDLIEKKRAIANANNGKAKNSDELRKWLNSPRHRATIDGLKEIRKRPNSPKPTELAAYLRSSAKAQGKSIKWVAEQLGQPFERVRHYFRTDEIGSRLPPEETWLKLKSLLSLDGTYDEAMEVVVGDNMFRNHPNGRNPGDVQNFALTGSSIKHFATMPVSLAEWCLRATLPSGGVCLDPFMGIGTTGRAALNLGGKFVGVDIKKEFLVVAEDVLG